MSVGGPTITPKFARGPKGVTPKRSSTAPGSAGGCSRLRVEVLEDVDDVRLSDHVALRLEHVERLTGDRHGGSVVADEGQHLNQIHEGVPLGVGFLCSGCEPYCLPRDPFGFLSLAP